MRRRGIPPELQSLCEELDALGGGDAKMERVETICVLSKHGNDGQQEEKAAVVGVAESSEATAAAGAGAPRAAIRHLGEGKVMVAGHAVGSARCYSTNSFVEASEQETLSDLVAVP